MHPGPADARFEEQIEDGKLARDPNTPGGGLEAVAAGGMHTLTIDEGGRIRSWGINDNACLGRVTSDVLDADGNVIENEALETVPFVIESLEKENFRAVSVAAGDSVSVAVSDKGEIRAWGSFRVGDGLTQLTLGKRRRSRLRRSSRSQSVSVYSNLPRFFAKGQGRSSRLWGKSRPRVDHCRSRVCLGKWTAKPTRSTDHGSTSVKWIGA